MSVEEIMRRLCDEAPDLDRMKFLRLLVAELTMMMLQGEECPVEFAVPMRFEDGSALSVPVRLRIEEGATIVRLANVLGTRNVSGPTLIVRSADLVDGDDGHRSLGLVLFVDDRPALAVGVLACGQALYLRSEGFERAVVGMADEVPGLWSRVRRNMWSAASGLVNSVKRLSSKLGKKTGMRGLNICDGGATRRRSPKQVLDVGSGSRSLTLSFPAMTIRRAMRPIFIHPEAGKSDRAASVPLLIPIRGTKPGAGAYPTRAVIERLRQALGVHTLLTDHSLRQLLGTRTASELAIRQVAGDKVGHLLKIGREHLTLRTGFDTEDEVVAWAAARYRDVPEGNRNTSAVRATRDMELAAVDLLTRAYNHAMRVSAAFDVAEGRSADAMASTLEAVFLERVNRTGMPVSELFQVAVFADINPSVFWPQHIEAFAGVFEAGRFMGRVQAGVSGEVSVTVVDLLLSYRDGPPMRDAAGDLVGIVWQAIDDILGGDFFFAMLRRARRTGGTLVIERSSRRLSITRKTHARCQAS